MPHLAPRPLIGQAEQVVDWVPTEGEVGDPLNKDMQLLLSGQHPSMSPPLPLREHGSMGAWAGRGSVHGGCRLLRTHRFCYQPDHWRGCCRLEDLVGEAGEVNAGRWVNIFTQCTCFNGIFFVFVFTLWGLGIDCPVAPTRSVSRGRWSGWVAHAFRVWTLLVTQSGPLRLPPLGRPVRW